MEVLRGLACGAASITEQAQSGAERVGLGVSLIEQLENVCCERANCTNCGFRSVVSTSAGVGFGFVEVEGFGEFHVLDLVFCFLSSGVLPFDA
jgi:hypothetical protein